MYIGYHRGGIATTGYAAQIYDLLSCRQHITWAVIWRDREDCEIYYTRLSNVHNAGCCCRATTGRCAGYGVLPVIADGMDIGDRRSGVTDTSAASYRSGSQDQGSGWCYTEADREGFRGRHTWCLDVNNAGRSCRTTS